MVSASESDRRLMSGLLTRAGYEPISAENMEAAKEAVAQLPPGAVIVADSKLPDGTAKEFSNWLKTDGFSFPVIAIVDNMNGIDIVEIMKDGGAIDVMQRAALNKQTVETVGRYAKPENIVLHLDNALIPRSSAAFRKIEKSIVDIAATNANCIIFGECGTGKEQIARQIYLQSSRIQKPLKILEAGGAALVGKHDPESEFSEIYNRIEGYFQETKGGTLIVKNIQYLTFEKQSVLLHILEQEHKDVRVICTANNTLLKMVADGKFRDNLFFTLRQASITVPALRETTEDIPEIADFLFTKYAQKVSQTKKRLDVSAIKKLKLHPWPGNIRELKDTILFAAFHAKDEVITADDIRFDPAMPETTESLVHRDPKAEKQRIIKAYAQAGTWRGAAALLHVTERTLIELRKKHGINRSGKDMNLPGS